MPPRPDPPARHFVTVQLAMAKIAARSNAFRFNARTLPRSAAYRFALSRYSASRHSSFVPPLSVIAYQRSMNSAVSGCAAKLAQNSS